MGIFKSSEFFEPQSEIDEREQEFRAAKAAQDIESTVREIGLDAINAKLSGVQLVKPLPVPLLTTADLPTPF